MKEQYSHKVNRRMLLRSAGGLMLGLPLLDAFMPRKLAAQEAVRSPFVLVVVGDNGVVQAGATLEGNGEPEMFWRTATGTLTRQGMLEDNASRAIGELADHADRLLVVRGVNLPFASTGCSHSAADAQVLTAASITAGSTDAVATGVSADTVIAQAKNPPGRDPLVLHAGRFSPGGTGFDIPGYVSYVSPNQPRVYSDSPYAAYEAIIGAVGDGTTGTSAEVEAQMLRADRSKSINDILRPQIQDLLAQPALSQNDRDRLDQHLTAIRDIEVQMTTTAFTVPEADIEAMQRIHPDPYNQATREDAVRPFMDLMVFSAVADYSRVAVLKIGDRIDDHVYSINGQSFKYRWAPVRAL
jgi:hypothetical protein